MNKLNNFSGFSALLLSAIIYASFGFFIRELDKMFGEYTQIFARSAIAFIIGIFLVFWNKNSLKLSKKNWFKVGLFSLSFPIAIIFFTFSINEIKAANTVFLLYAGNIATSLILGTIFLKEKLNRYKVLALILVVIGLAIFSSPLSSLEISTGFVFGILSGLFDGLTNFLRKDIRDVPRNTLLSYQYFIGSILALFLALISGETILKEFIVGSFIILICFGAALILLGNLLIYGFKHYDVNVGSIILASEILFAVILGYFLLQETPSTNEFIGGLVIFFAAIISSVDSKWIEKAFNFGRSK